MDSCPCFIRWIRNTIPILAILLLHYNNHIVADEVQNIDRSVQCVDADPEVWSIWYRGSYSIVSLKGNGTRCFTECFHNCTCSLSTTFTINCQHGTTSLSLNRLYPSIIRYLNWADSAIHDIQPGSFSMVADTLEILHLNGMRLTHLRPGVFNNLTRLEWLWLNTNFLKEIKPGLFEDLTSLKTLWLSSNELNALQPGVFEGLSKLEWLFLSYNQLSMIHSLLFSGLNQLNILYLKNNIISELQADVFNPIRNLSILDLSRNSIRQISHDVFNVLNEMKYLDLGNNYLEKVHSGVLKARDMTTLDLNDNDIELLEPNTFQNIHKLDSLTLSNNRLLSLHSDIFETQTHLQYLHLDRNQLRYLPQDIFRAMLQLRALNLSSNHLLQVNSGLFLQCVSLEVVDLGENPLEWIEDRSLSVMNETTKIFVTRYSTCCFTSAHCLYDVPPAPYLTCKRLLPSILLRIAIWFISILTIVANICAFYIIFRRRRRAIKVQSFLITNLSISDFLMGIYLATLLSVDLYYKDYFPSHSDTWRGSVLCKIAGAVSVLSSEASAFFIMLVSIDRLMGVKYTFSNYRLGTRSVRCTVLILWLIALGISVSSLVISEIDSDFYSVSEVCVGLPISRKNIFVKTNDTIKLRTEWHTSGGPRIVSEYVKADSNTSMFFSIATFTGLNSLCFLIVGYCYIAIFVYARKTTKKSGRSSNTNEEIRMAMKMSLIVLTDFCCWVPIGVLSILVQTGMVETDPVAYAWIATFILPINSSLNPILYTLGTVLSNKVKLRDGNDIWRKQETTMDTLNEVEKKVSK